MGIQQASQRAAFEWGGGGGPADSERETTVNLINSFLTLGLRQMQHDLGDQKCVFLDQEYWCIPSTLHQGEIVAVGGRSYTIQLTLHMMQSDFPRAITADMMNITVDSTIPVDYDYPAPPRPGDLITYPAYPKDHSLAYRVFQRSSSADESFYSFQLIDKDT
jgi:hypothetical protein